MFIRMILYSALFCFGCSGCMQAHSEDDLRAVPVTNNPNLIPRTTQTAQGPNF